MALASVITLALASALPLLWRTSPANGLPGYEHIRGLPRTDVYSWVQSHSAPLRIYSAGLRPYGLYGPAWRNTLFYDLHSTLLSPLEFGKTRISAIVVRFRPDLIIVSVDPHSYSGEPKKPAIVNWMRTQSTLFEQVYSDGAVSVFKVQAGAADYLRDQVPQGYELRMGG